MNSPKRYEEMARAVVPYDKYLDYEEDNNATWNATIVMPVAEALRTAAREAQVRALREVFPLLMRLRDDRDRQDADRGVKALIRRLDSGEDL